MNVAIGFSQSADGAAPAEFARVPGGIVDATGTFVYLTQLRLGDFGVVAVNAQNGEILWERAREAKPLALVGDQLLVLAPEPRKQGVLRVHFLDVKAKGALVRESEPLTFPNARWVGDGGRATPSGRAEPSLRPKSSRQPDRPSWVSQRSTCVLAPW
jgi:hypothetical protein